jgi:hypothetical protein
MMVVKRMFLVISKLIYDLKIEKIMRVESYISSNIGVVVGWWIYPLIKDALGLPMPVSIHQLICL